MPPIPEKLKKSTLTEQQKAFADYYIETGNGTEAYLKAGFNCTKKSAQARSGRLLENPLVKEYLQDRYKQLESDRVATAQEVLEYLTSVMRGKITEETVVVESIGDFMSEAKIIKKEVTPKDRNKAAELLAKRYALLTENTNVNGAIPVQIINDIPQEEE